jgi:uncharacterized protein
MANPFTPDVPVAPSELIDRKVELGRLLELARGGHNSRLSAPRRFGKTSVLRALGDLVEREGMNWVHVDFFGVLSPADVAARIELAYVDALKGPVASWYAAFRRRWRMKARGGVPGAGMEVESLSPHEAADALHELLDLPKAVHDRSGKPTVVGFDEFQEVLSAGGNIDGLIRSRIQHHRHEAAYVFCGSHPGLMAELFSDKERPLYGQARQVEVGPLPDEDLARFIDDGFRTTGREVGRALDQLLEWVRGHPQRAILMSHHLWNRTPPQTTSGPEEWEAAVRDAFKELQEPFERYWEKLSANERRVLAAAAWTGPWGGGTSFLAKDTLARFQLSKSSARDTSRSLVRSGDLLVEDSSRYVIVDPLLEAWIASGRRPLF